MIFENGSDIKYTTIERDIIAKSLTETEKFGFDDKKELILGLIDAKIPHLKTQILELKEVMVKSAGHINSDNYDSALLKMLDEVKKVKG